jgi:probable HAF family extracellular repeat protein
MGTLGGSTSVAWAINDAGAVAGFSELPNHENRAFRTSASGVINPATDNLGTLGGAFSVARGINNAGQVVGESATTTGSIHAFRTAENSAIQAGTDDLGTLGGANSSAWGINNAGQVVGTSSGADGAIRAFLYTGGHMRDLNDLIAAGSGWTLDAATAINDAGQIVGVGHPDSSAPVTRAYRLDPTAAGLVDVLIDSVQSAGMKGSLQPLLDGAAASMSKDNQRAAAMQLGAFQQAVEAARGKSLSEGQADLLCRLAARAAAMLAVARERPQAVK